MAYDQIEAVLNAEPYLGCANLNTLLDNHPVDIEQPELRRFTTDAGLWEEMPSGNWHFFGVQYGVHSIWVEWETEMGHLDLPDGTRVWYYARGA